VRAVSVKNNKNTKSVRVVKESSSSKYTVKMESGWYSDFFCIF